MNKRGFYGEMGYNPAEQDKPKNYYEILGLKPNALIEEIEESWNNYLKHELHPDQIDSLPNGAVKEASQKRFDEALEAYKTLSNKTLREKYNLALSESKPEDDAPPQDVDFYA